MVVVFRLNHLDLSLSAQNYCGSESVVDCGFFIHSPNREGSRSWFHMV